ncbi:MAG: L-histidine N(alpha)-methyltransferase [Allosphingosinicella sp.]
MDAPRVIAVDPAFRRDVLAGLAAPVRAIPSRWFYDRRGSELFEAITRLPDYYLTRTETALLEAHGPEVAALAGAGNAIVEFGSGSSTKTRILIRDARPAAYVPIDISGEFLREAAREIAEAFPKVAVHPAEGDFMRAIALPDAVAGMAKLGFFPGSTIGNMVAGTAVDLLRAMKATLGVGAWLLLGLDRVKDPHEMLRAYDDPDGVTAAFNLNLLERINRELDGDVPLDAFRHEALWNEARSRIEMHLQAVRDVRFAVAGLAFEMKTGETIHTENSHKYGTRDARFMLHAGGWSVEREWSDPDERFTILLAKAEAERFAP